MTHFKSLRAVLFCAATVTMALAAGSAPAQQMAMAAKVDSPSGPVDGPMDVNAALQRFPLVASDKTVKQLLPNWATPKEIVVVVDRPERTAWLQAAMPAGVKVVGVANDVEAAKELNSADAYVMAGGDCTPANWANSKTLKWIHSAAGGGDQCMSVAPALASGKVLFTNSQKVKSDGLAETAFGFIFALARNMDIAVDNQRAHAFGRATRPAKSLAGATMLVVGLGGAGTEIAQLAHDFGMTVIATRASSHEGPDYVQYVGLSSELPDMIGKADVVVIAAPLTPETKGMFNSALFSKMKKGAMVVNFTRAEIINADDLAAALKDGRVGSAGLAWASDEPLPPTHPLWTAPNLILTPWGGSGGGAGPMVNPGLAKAPAPGAGATPSLAAARAGGNVANPVVQRENELRWVLVRENMRRFAAGEKMYSVFDVKRGY